MMIRFGGADAFCAAWKEAIDTASRERPGTRLVLDSFLAILRLLEVCDATRRERDVSTLSDEELERELQTLLKMVTITHR